MILQIDYCTNILKFLHTDIYFIFIFDHSYGNYIGRENRMNIRKINS